MATITLKNIPDRLYQRLKYFAKLHHRSLNSEIIFNLEKSVGLAGEDPARPAYPDHRFPGTPGQKWSVNPGGN